MMKQLHPATLFLFFFSLFLLSTLLVLPAAVALADQEETSASQQGGNDDYYPEEDEDQLEDPQDGSSLNTTKFLTPYEKTDKLIDALANPDKDYGFSEHALTVGTVDAAVVMETLTGSQIDAIAEHAMNDTDTYYDLGRDQEDEEDGDVDEEEEASSWSFDASTFADGGDS